MTRAMAKMAPMIIAKAANISGSNHNPEYTVANFRSTYPQFTSEIISDESVAEYITLCNSMISYDMYGDQWKRSMSLAIAHFITMDLMTRGASATPTIQGIVSSAKGAIGMLTSKSVGDVSASYSTEYLSSLTSWGTWNLTIFGQQFATIAKLMGKANMYVW